MIARLALVLVLALTSEAFSAAPPARLRDALGDELPAGADARLGSIRLRHSFGMRSDLAISPDGSKVASVCDTIRIWDRATGRLLREIDPNIELAWCLAFTPDGKRLIAGYGVGTKLDNHLGIFDLTTGKCESFFGDDEEQQPVKQIAFSSDGKSLVARCGFRRSRIRAFDFASRKELDLSAAGNKHLANAFRTLALSPDGKTCAMASTDGMLTLVRLEPPFKAVLTDVKSPGYGAACFSADGKELYVGTYRQGVFALDTQTGKKKRTIVAVDEARGRYLYTFSANGRYVVCTDRLAIQVFDTKTGALASPSSDHHEADGIDAAPSPDGKRVATRSRSQIRIWDLKTGRRLVAIEGTDFAPGLRWTPDGKSIAVGQPEKFCWYRAEDGKLLREAPAPPGFLRASLLSDGKSISWRSYLGDGIDLADDKSPGKTKRIVLTDRRGSEVLAFSADGKRTLWRIWDKRQHAVKKLDGAVIWSHPTTTISFESGFFAGRFVVLSREAGVQTWNVDRGQLAGPPAPQRDKSQLFVPLCLSPDERTLVLAHQQRLETGTSSRRLSFSRVQLVELSSGLVRQELSQVPTVINASFTRDGRYLVTGSSNGTGHVFEVDALPQRIDKEKTWTALRSADGRLGFAAVCSLAAAPDFAVDMLKRGLAPAVVDAKAVRQWLADLGNDAFERRENARRRLAALGEDIEEDLLALKKTPSLSVRWRVLRLLEAIEKGNPASWRRARAVEVLERIGSPEATALLKKLAAAYPGSRLTRMAQESLKRLQRRS